MDKQIKKGDIILNQYEAINDSSIKGCIESVDCVDSKAKNKKYLLYRTENKINYQTYLYLYNNYKSFPNGIKKLYYSSEFSLYENSVLYLLFVKDEKFIRLSSYISLSKQKLNESTVNHIIGILVKGLKPLLELGIDVSFLINPQNILVQYENNNTISNKGKMLLDLFSFDEHVHLLSGTKIYMSRIQLNAFNYSAQYPLAYYSQNSIWQIGQLTIYLLTLKKIKCLSSNVYLSNKGMEIPSDECIMFLKVTLQFSKKFQTNFANLECLDFLANQKRHYTYRISQSEKKTFRSKIKRIFL